MKPVRHGAMIPDEISTDISHVKLGERGYLPMGSRLWIPPTCDDECFDGDDADGPPEVIDVDCVVVTE